MLVRGDCAVRAERDAGAREPAGGGACADADDHGSGRELTAVGEDHRSGLDTGHARVGDEFDAVLRVPVGHRGGDLCGQGAREGPVGRLDDGDRAAGLAGGRGEFRADPARADDHYVVLLDEHGAQPCGIVEGAQQMNPGNALGARQRDRLGAAGDDQDVVRDGSRLGVQFMITRAHALHLAAQPQLDAERLEVDLEGRALGLAEQDRLGEGRPVVRLVGLGADQGDGSGEALLAQGHGGLDPGHSRADDDHAPRCLCCLLLLAHPATLRI